MTDSDKLDLLVPYLVDDTCHCAACLRSVVFKSQTKSRCKYLVYLDSIKSGIEQEGLCGQWIAVKTLVMLPGIVGKRLYSSIQNLFRVHEKRTTLYNRSESEEQAGLLIMKTGPGCTPRNLVRYNGGSTTPSAWVKENCMSVREQNHFILLLRTAQQKEAKTQHVLKSAEPIETKDSHLASLERDIALHLESAQKVKEIYDKYDLIPSLEQKVDDLQKALVQQAQMTEELKSRVDIVTQYLYKFHSDNERLTQTSAKQEKRKQREESPPREKAMQTRARSAKSRKRR